MATETPVKDAKLVQYLNEAYGKEKELETTLQAHIGMAQRPPHKKRLQEHLRETKAQAKALERRIKALGGKAERTPLPGPDALTDGATAVTAVASKAVAAAKGPLHALRGTGAAEVELKNARTELSEEFQEIGHYLAIEALAEQVGDRETAKLARDHRRQEERMAAFLQKQIPLLTKQVVRDEIPASERRNNGARRTRSNSSGPRKRTTTKRTTTKRATARGRTRKPASSGSRTRSTSGS